MQGTSTLSLVHSVRSRPEITLKSLAAVVMQLWLGAGSSVSSDMLIYLFSEVLRIESPLEMTVEALLTWLRNRVKVLAFVKSPYLYCLSALPEPVIFGQ